MRARSQRVPGKAELRRLAEGIVLAQGNVFIKELLREKRLRIGATKAEFVKNLNAAIDAGDLTADDIEGWLHRVEGWGTEHVYLYRVPSEISKMEVWRDPERVRKVVTDVGLGHLWNARSSLEFPKKPTLTGIYYEQGRLRFLWHEGFLSLKREQDYDFEQVIEGERYEFHAHRERSQRAVMRFDVRPRDRVAAAFLQVPVTSEEHTDALEQMWEAVLPLLRRDQLKLFDMSAAIKALDQLQLVEEASSLVRTHQARLSGQGAYVEFGATGRDRGYREVEPIREVRRALQPETVTGDRAIILFSTPEGMGPSRDVRVQLYGHDRRLWLRSQMTEEQVWYLLNQIRKTK